MTVCYWDPSDKVDKKAVSLSNLNNLKLYIPVSFLPIKYWTTYSLWPTILYLRNWGRESADHHNVWNSKFNKLILYTQFPPMFLSSWYKRSLYKSCKSRTSTISCVGFALAGLNVLSAPSTCDQITLTEFNLRLQIYSKGTF